MSKGTGVICAVGTRGQQGFSKQEQRRDVQPHLVTAGRAQMDWEFALFFLSPRWQGVAGSSRSEQLAPDLPCSPETNFEPYSPAFAIEEGQMACLCPWGQVSWQWDSGLPAPPTSLLRSGILLPSREAWPRRRVREGEGPWDLLGHVGAPAETWFQAHALILSECFYTD